jgi:uncharacterized membrane protein YdbT with pleckstrin-like domain
MKPEQPTDYDQPVAYDKDGNPLYARPPKNDKEPVQQVVHVARPLDPEEQVVSPEMLKKHEDSVAKHPTLNLSKGEYIISEVRRHWVGLVGLVFTGGLLAVLVLIGLAMYPSLVPSGNPPFDALLMPALLLLVLIGLGTYIVVWVYVNNKFFLTNESVIQEIQTSLFAHHEQTVSLSNIEDASYTQSGLLQMLFNYGSIRLSTEGDETTYRFHYVSNPKQQIAILNNAVEAFKNGRPVDGE